MSKGVKVPQRVLDRAEVLHFYGKEISEIAKKLGYSNRTFTRYAQKNQWGNDRLPAFTYDDLLTDFQNLLFMLLQSEINRVRNNEEIDLVRMSLGFKNIVSLIKDLSALAPLIASAFIIENVPKIIHDLPEDLDPNVKQEVIAVLENYAEKSRSHMAGIQEEA